MIKLHPLNESRAWQEIQAESEERGVAELFSEAKACVERAKASGAFAARRARDRRAWLHDELERALRERFLRTPGVPEKLAELEQKVESGALSPRGAAAALFDSAPPRS